MNAKYYANADVFESQKYSNTYSISPLQVWDSILLSKYGLIAAHHVWLEEILEKNLAGARILFTRIYSYLLWVSSFKVRSEDQNIRTVFSLFMEGRYFN